MHFKKCEICSKIFFQKRKGMNCCSRKCRDLFTLYKKGQKCILCNKIFYQKKRTNYCSEKCKQLFQKESQQSRKCKYCGKLFFAKTKNSHQKFCSNYCRHSQLVEETKKKCICDYCKKEYEKIKWSVDGNNSFCSHSCCIAFSYQHNLINAKFSKPHQIINKLLEDIKEEYVNEKALYKYSLDIYLPKYSLGIEIMGTYWHGDSRFYSQNKLEQRQIKCIEKDSRKEKLFLENGIPILYLWQEDIKNLKKCELLIKKFIENPMIQNHSSSYILCNNNIVKDKKEIKQFMDRL